MAGGECKYRCRSASETQEWISAIINFITPYTFFLQAHVVNFFKDKLWEAVDKDWTASLRDEPVENLLQIPSGLVQDHWPTSLNDFILTLRSLKLPREQADLKKVLPDLQMTPLNNVLTQGMNRKKKHEIEALSAAVSSIARNVGANTIIDVGAGQGYLAQALTFQYQLSVIAIDACSHHGRITDARAERIKKHYAAKMRKSRLEDRDLSVPKTVTCRVLSSDALKALSNSLLQKDDVAQPNLTTRGVGEHSDRGLCERKEPSLSYEGHTSSLLLAGLHACGDLSVTMLRTFLECKEVKAVVSIGCCYNLLSEEGDENTDAQCGFPMSKGVKVAGLSLGKSLRDLACQSAERWRGLGKDAGLHNFELHVFRAAFQMVLFRYYPEILMTSPTIGRQGKALRRKQQQGILESTMKSAETLTSKNKGSTWDSDAFFRGVSCNEINKSEKTESVGRFSLFKKFCQSGLCRLGVQNSQDIDFAGIWKETEPFSELIGPYWTLRASLGPVLETLLLLDRLLFLQEQGSSLEAVILPIFDPTLSPRNMALIAKKI